MSFNSAGSAFQRVLVPKAPHRSHLNGSMNEQGEEQSHTGPGLMDQWNSYVQGPPLEQEGYNEGDYGKVVGHDYSNYNFMPAGNAYMCERAGALGPTGAGEGGNGQRGRLQGPLATSNSQHNSHHGAPSPDIMDLVSKIPAPPVKVAKTLTEEQRQRMEENRRKALEKRAQVLQQQQKLQQQQSVMFKANFNM